MNNKKKEFELSFNYKNVLYIAQVTTWLHLNDNYYLIDYFSPNEKGKIRLLCTTDKNGTQWLEPGQKHNSGFVEEIINQLGLHK